MWGWLVTPLSWFGVTVVALSFGLYFALQLICGTYYKYQNLKDRYGATWALVTGASTGCIKTVSASLCLDTFSIACDLGI